MEHKKLLILAITVGLLAGFFSLRLHARTVNEFKQRATQAVEIVVARRALPAGHPLDVNEDLRVERVPEDMQGGALSPDFVNSYDGRVLVSGLPVGQPVRASNFAPIEELVIEEGKVAVTIVPADTAIADLLVPGISRINVLVYREYGDGRDGEAFTILENIRVVAVGDQISGSTTDISDAEFRRMRPRAGRAVTVEITQEQHRLFLKESDGGRHMVTFSLLPVQS